MRSFYKHAQLLQACAAGRLKSRMCWLLVEWQMPAVDRSYDRHLLTDLHKDPFGHMEPRYAYLLVINTWDTQVCVVISSPYITHAGYAQWTSSNVNIIGSACLRSDGIKGLSKNSRDTSHQLQLNQITVQVVHTPVLYMEVPGVSTG